MLTATPVNTSAGARFRQALSEEQPLQIMGTINAYTALMAKQVCLTSASPPSTMC
jgi:methylisocitrate lyase